MTTMFFESDINTQALENLCVAMIGYGSQGRGQAMNLRDSGINVVVGLREGGKSWNQAVSEGWTPLSMEDAAKQADVVCMMCPDMAQPQVYPRYCGTQPETRFHRSILPWILYPLRSNYGHPRQQCRDACPERAWRHGPTAI